MEIRLIASLSVILALGSSGTLLADQAKLPASGMQTRWPSLDRAVGAVGITSANDVKQSSRLGLHLNLASYVNPHELAGRAMHSQRTHYLDDYLWRQIAEVCQQQGSFSKDTPCVIDPSNEASIERSAAKHLRAVRNDNNIVGFWILDDWPHSTILPTLSALHNLIVKANRSRSSPRPAVCGLGGALDYKTSPHQKAFKSDHTYFDSAVANYSHSACDAVGLYLYGASVWRNSGAVDRSMSKLMPYVMKALRSRGFNPKRTPLIGMPQAFAYGWEAAEKKCPGCMHYILPTGRDLALQVSSFCRQGASGIVPYTWRDGNTELGTYELYNSAGLRRGLLQGIAGCRQIWTTKGRRLGKRPPVSRRLASSAAAQSLSPLAWGTQHTGAWT